MKTSVVTARLDEETLAKLDTLAEARERSRAWLVAKAVKRFVEEEEAFAAFTRAGDDDFARGDVLTQEQMETWFADRHRAADAA